MNQFSRILVCLLLMQIFFYCQKEETPEQRFIGKWVSADLVDTLIFNNNLTFNKLFAAGSSSMFHYSCKSDSLTIQYFGPLFIYVKPSNHYYHFENSIVIIDCSNGCFGLESKKKIYVKQ
jgi:hypothetical protein